QRVALGRQRLSAFFLLSRCRILTGLSLTQRLGAELTRRGEAQRRISLRIFDRLGLAVAFDQAGAEGELALESAEAVADDVALAAGGEHHDAQAGAAAI